MDLSSIYISPLELCNLNCRYCYTKKTKNILSNQKILDFIDRYSHFTPLKSIIFCGGEVFTLPDFPILVNTLQNQGLFITIITNGTIDKLAQINNPSNCQLLVSFDGPEVIHDANRGKGNFKKSSDFVTKALSLGFPVEIMFLVTKDSYPYIDTFSVQNLANTYLTDRLHSLTASQTIEIKRNYKTFPPKSFHCSQLSLQSDGLIYGCCESPHPIAKMTDPIKTIIDNFKKSFQHSPLGCCAPDFLCDYKNVVQLINKL